MKNTKSIITKYASTVAIGALLAFLTLEMNGFWDMTEAVEKYRVLTNAFSIPGVIFIMVGCLVFVSTDGFFDMISYGLGKFGKSLIPFSQKSNETFYEYKKRKDGERFTGYSFLFYTGIAFCLTSAVFLILFYSVY